MDTSTPSKTILVLTAWVFCGLGVASAAGAEDKKLPHIAPVQLRDHDASRDIPPTAGPRKAQTLKPRKVPGYEQLSSALSSSERGSVAAFLANGADPNATSKDGQPVLHYAISARHQEPIEDLLRAGADPNLADKNKSTPLHAAVYYGQAHTVEFLLKYGADPTRKGSTGTTPLEDARYYKNKALVALLEAPPASPLAARRIELPTILRRPDAVFGSARFRAAGGGQALAYTADSRQLIAGDDKGGLRFLDAQTGEMRNVIDAHEGTVLGVAMIPKSPVLVSAGYDQTVRFWNSETSQELMRLRWGSRSLAVSPDGKLLYTGYHLWQIESVEPLKLAPRGLEFKDPTPNAGSWWSFFTPDSRYLVVGRYSSGIWVWDLKKETIRKLDKLDLATTKAIRWKDLAAVCDIGAARPDDLLALVSGQYLGAIVTGSPPVLDALASKMPSATGAARVLACSPDGQYLAALGHDSRIDVYDLENKGSKLKHDGHTTAVQTVCASPDGQLIASGGSDKTTRIWNRKTGKQLAEIPTVSFVYCVRFSPDSKLLAIGDSNANLYLWDVKARSLQAYHVAGMLTDLAFTSGGQLLVLGDQLHLFDMKTPATNAMLRVANSNQGTLAVAPDGVIVSSARSRAIGENLWVPEAWQLTGNKLSEKKDLFSPAMGHRHSITAVAFSPDGSILATASASAIRLWDMKQRQPLGGKMCGHTTSLAYLRFSPDGKWLASCSWDGTARVWEVASGRQALVIDADVDRVSGVDFTPDGQMVTANWDGTVHLWDLPKHLKAPGAK